MWWRNLSHRDHPPGIGDMDNWCRKLGEFYNGLCYVVRLQLPYRTSLVDWLFFVVLHFSCRQGHHRHVASEYRFRLPA